VHIERIGLGEVDRVVAASRLFDDPATPEWTTRFLSSPGHHLLFALVDGVDVGFVSGVETTHPDKGTEMFLYELGVDESARGRGVGKALVAALGDLARERGCHGMWVSTEADNRAALATYRSAGAGTPEPGVVLTWTLVRSV
jgi:ribosomal protein S18 acetylase RimI-like enzyme